jgi:hypothetical protein
MGARSLWSRGRTARCSEPPRGWRRPPRRTSSPGAPPSHAAPRPLGRVHLIGGRGAAARRRVDVLDLGELIVVDDRKVEHDLVGMRRGGSQEVALRAEVQRHRRDHFFPDGIEGRVGDLGELLGEVVEQQPRAVRQHGDGRVGTHGAQRFRAVLRHRRDQDAHLLLGVTESPLAPGDGCRRVHDVLAVREVLEVDPTVLQPFAPTVRRRTART